MEKNNLLLEVKGLKKYFPLQKNLFGKPKFQLRAVDDVSFTLEKGKTIGVVGESGCGKTTLGRTILQLYDTTGGKTLYHGHTVFEFAPKYFLDALRNIDDEEIFVDFGTSISPCIIRPVDEEGDYTYMILPIKLKD